MRIGIVSDIHGKDSVLDHALGVLKHEAVESVICLGDVLGKSGDCLRCLDLLFDAKARIVRGNHDRQNFSELPKPYQEKMQRHMTGMLRIDNLLFSHTATCPDAFYGRGIWDDDRISSPAKAEAQFKSDPSWVFFYGHVHTPSLYEFDGSSVPGYLPITGPQRIVLKANARYLCDTGPITDRKDIDIDIENPHRKERTPRIPSFVIFDNGARELRYEFVPLGVDGRPQTH